MPRPFLPVRGGDEGTPLGAHERDVVQTTSGYDPWVGSRRVVPVRPHYRSWLTRQVIAGPLLEIGPGLRPTAPVATSYFVDRSSHALAELAIRGARTAAVDGSLPFPDAFFGAVLAFEVLEHVEDDASLLDEIARVLRAGGLFLMSTPVHRAKWSVLDDACHHVRRDEPDELFGKVRSRGFRIEGYTFTRSEARWLTRMRARVLQANRGAATACVQGIFFPAHAAYQRYFAHVRWTSPDVPVPARADDLVLHARLTAGPGSGPA
jgi:SAM-dependent methyltransferase